MSNTFEQIMELPDTYDIKDIVRRWEILSDKLKNELAKKPIILPDILMIAKNGVGKTHVLKLLSEYLSSKENLISFYGDVKFFEFYVNYCKPDEDFSEIRRLMSAVNSAAGFRSEYRGIISLDIDEWVGHHEEKHFIDLLEYLSVNSDYWLIVFNVSNGDRKAVKALEAVISMLLRVERAEVRLPEVSELISHIKKKLEDYGISLDRSAETLLEETVKTISVSEYFDGYKTIDMISKDIVYKFYTMTESLDRPLGASDLTDFSSDSEYAQSRLVSIVTEKKPIGFK